MKVRITEDTKKSIYASQLAAARKIVEDLKEDDGLEEYCQMAARVASGSNAEFELFKLNAEIAGNCRVENSFDSDSGNLDVWITFYAFHFYEGFYKIGVYLTDIWSIDGENNAEIKKHMYIDHYTADRLKS